MKKFHSPLAVTDRPARSANHGVLGLLRQAEARILADFRRVVGKEGLTPSEYGVLQLVRDNEGLCQSRLGEALGIDRSTVVSLMDRFEERNLLRRTPSPRDRRSYALYLTEPAEALMLRLKPSIDAHERAVLDDLSGEERLQLVDLLNRLGAH